MKGPFKDGSCSKEGILVAAAGSKELENFQALEQHFSSPPKASTIFFTGSKCIYFDNFLVNVINVNCGPDLSKDICYNTS